MAREIPVWRLDQVLGRWTRVNAQARAHPGEILLVSAADGACHLVRSALIAVCVAAGQLLRPTPPRTRRTGGLELF
jgi:hypothetical protein